MTKMLITGANKGLGYRTAQRPLAQGHEVWVATRSWAKLQPSRSTPGSCRST